MRPSSDGFTAWLKIFRLEETDTLEADVGRSVGAAFESFEANIVESVSVERNSLADMIPVFLCFLFFYFKVKPQMNC